MVSSGISPSFPGLSQTRRQITHALLTRAPLEYPPKGAFPYDLHVLSTPPAFVLSQDQTLQFEPCPGTPRLYETVACDTRLFGKREPSTQPKSRLELAKREIPSSTIRSNFPMIDMDRTLFSFQRANEALRGLFRASEALDPMGPHSAAGWR